ncbi:MAG: hypothetical protein QXO12_01200 [Candidatus Pacearchaeota archaeon]
MKKSKYIFAFFLFVIFFLIFLINVNAANLEVNWVPQEIYQHNYSILYFKLKITGSVSPPSKLYPITINITKGGSYVLLNEKIGWKEVSCSNIPQTPPNECINIDPNIHYCTTYLGCCYIACLNFTPPLETGSGTYNASYKFKIEGWGGGTYNWSKLLQVKSTFDYVKWDTSKINYGDRVKLIIKPNATEVDKVNVTICLGSRSKCCVVTGFNNIPVINGWANITLGPENYSKWFNSWCWRDHGCTSENCSFWAIAHYKYVSNKSFNNLSINFLKIDRAQWRLCEINRRGICYYNYYNENSTGKIAIHVDNCDNLINKKVNVKIIKKINQTSQEIIDEFNLSFSQCWANALINISNFTKINCTQDPKGYPRYIFNVSLVDCPQVFNISNPAIVCKNGTLIIPRVKLIEPKTFCDESSQTDKCCKFPDGEPTPYYNKLEYNSTSGYWEARIWHNASGENYKCWRMETNDGVLIQSYENSSSPIENKTFLYKYTGTHSPFGWRGISSKIAVDNYCSQNDVDYYYYDKKIFVLEDCARPYPPLVEIISPENLKKYPKGSITFKAKVFDLDTPSEGVKVTWWITEEGYSKIIYQSSCYLNQPDCTNFSFYIDEPETYKVAIRVEEVEDDKYYSTDEVIFDVREEVPSPPPPQQYPNITQAFWNNCSYNQSGNCYYNENSTGKIAIYVENCGSLSNKSVNVTIIKINQTQSIINSSYLSINESDCWANTTINVSNFDKINCTQNSNGEPYYIFNASLVENASIFKISNEARVCKNGTQPSLQYPNITQAFWNNCSSSNDSICYYDENSTGKIAIYVENCSSLTNKNVTVKIKSISTSPQPEIPIPLKGISWIIKDLWTGFASFITGKIIDFPIEEEFNITINPTTCWANKSGNISNFKAINCSKPLSTYYYFEAYLAGNKSINKTSSNKAVRCKEGTTPIKIEVNIEEPKEICNESNQKYNCCPENKSYAYNASKAIWHNGTGKNYEKWSWIGRGENVSVNLSKSGSVTQNMNLSHIYGLKQGKNFSFVNIILNLSKSNYYNFTTRKILIANCSANLPPMVEILHPKNKTYLENLPYKMNFNATIYSDNGWKNFTWILTYPLINPYYIYRCNSTSSTCPNTTINLNYSGSYNVTAIVTDKDNLYDVDNLIFTILPQNCKCDDGITPCYSWNCSREPESRYCNGSGKWVNYCINKNQCTCGDGDEDDNYICLNHKCVKQPSSEECSQHDDEYNCTNAGCLWDPCKSCSEANSLLGCSNYKGEYSCRQDVCGLGKYGPNNNNNNIIYLGCGWNGSVCIQNFTIISQPPYQDCEEYISTIGDCNTSETIIINYTYNNPQCCNSIWENCNGNSWYEKRIACPQPPTSKMPIWGWMNVILVISLILIYYYLKKKFKR